MTEPTPAQPDNLSMFTRRRIEAEVLGHVYQVLKASHGKEVAMQVIGALVHGYRWDRGYPNPAGA